MAANARPMARWARIIHVESNTRRAADGAALRVPERSHAPTWGWDVALRLLPRLRCGLRLYGLRLLL